MGPSATSDAELIAQLRSGTVEENKALETIYRIHFPVIAGYVKRNNGDRDAARDVFQDGVVVLYRHVKQGRFAAESSLGTYLYSICRFLWLKQLRAHGRLTGHEPSPDVLEDQPLSRSLSDGAGLAALFEQLGEVCRRVLLLSYFEGLDMRTIAARTGFKDEQNARNKKSKCLKGLRALIARDPRAAQWFNELREP
ncbi:MAG: sigma-70 family RNA polymerase sigma factor [Flavobacteriales bacterium]|nr:sigma-70 family RNA polymerase sigma factor [Flavobacteriales bacterium]MBP7514898.1 sigma-70 family RNA polymerase sigma factor [Flavobacteriales bacterium]